MDSMNFGWSPPISFDDLNALSAMVETSPAIVSALSDFENGDWKSLFEEHYLHNTEFYAHLDANFLSQLLRLFSAETLTQHAQQAAAMMALAITFNMNVNPTFATHEYAFTGSDEPDPRLAGFYYINNLHPQHLSDIALGKRNHCLPDLHTLPTTAHKGTHRQHLRMHGLTYSCLLKIVELDRDAKKFPGPRNVFNRARRAEALLDWMYHDFLFCGSPLLVADYLWGEPRRKTVLKGLDVCTSSNVLSICQNATWDLVLAENWAESESKRQPGDPFHLIFTFDRQLRELAGGLLATPDQLHQPHSERMLQKYGRSWPNEVATTLAEKYLHYESTLDSPLRMWNRENRPSNLQMTKELERSVCALFDI